MAKLHEDPPGPALIHPPAATPEDLAKYKADNKLKFMLTGKLGEAANELPGVFGRRNSHYLTDDGKPETRISPYSQSLKTYSDASTFKALHDDLVKTMRDEFSESLNKANDPDRWGYQGNKLTEEVGKLDFRTEPNYQAQLERRNILERLARQDADTVWPPHDRPLVRDRLAGQTNAVDGVLGLLQGDGVHPAHDGIVVGETHQNASSWGYLKDNMRGLKEAGVDTVYIEALRDESAQRDLDAFLKPGGEMSARLEKLVSAYDKQWKSPAGAGLHETLHAAKANGVRVRAIDGYAARTPNSGADMYQQRARLMNSYAHDVIARDREGQSGKYVVITGASHALQHTSMRPDQPIHGLADMLGVPPVRLNTPGGDEAFGYHPSNNLRLGLLEPTAANGHVMPGADAQQGNNPPPGNHPDANAAEQHHQDHQNQDNADFIDPAGLGNPPHDGAAPQHEQQPLHEQQPSHERESVQHEDGGPRHPASEGRPFDVEGGLKHPSEHEVKQLQDAVPHNADGTPQRHPDPLAGDWVKKLNGDGPGGPGRANNCADAALSLVDTYDGHPTVAAPRVEDNSAGEKGGRARIEQALGGKFEHLGKGQAGHDKLAQTLLDSGHGSQAVIITRDGEGRTHAWNAMNHNGRIVYADPQLGRTSETPLYQGEGGLFAVPLTPDRAPCTRPPRRPPPETTSRDRAPTGSRTPPCSVLGRTSGPATHRAPPSTPGPRSTPATPRSSSTRAAPSTRRWCPKRCRRSARPSTGSCTTPVSSCGTTGCPWTSPTASGSGCPD
ncbi:toxin glutamine deamidase domain-containing protein [Kitasatospora cheerisanensis]|uniref:Tox-PL domain-containing protein n=1 Tax=Kitasatospora cheerisanensis KCTC 2395 TaxID=1348663 RepID=A0A066YQ34_9ACTN|nr:toxin glutamine deamidase domain-containing protein [Kitasatospora cheerisanensis]KDN82099.1 hypothetical protein KCH_61150 [Kitasatospora cheerisanensis KCTC 2395]